ncbi:RFX-like DNA-binding protein RFX2 [Spathaspora sp. JA1]|nr:RFX-like DNA-binding protein RFX2 [Spathaspora sp. JA1]
MSHNTSKYRSHKRQKSSASNPTYYVTQQQQQQQHAHQQQQQAQHQHQHSRQQSEQPQQGSPQQLSTQPQQHRHASSSHLPQQFDNDTYISSYNYTPGSRSNPISKLPPSSSSSSTLPQPMSSGNLDISSHTHLSTSPMKRVASSELDSTSVMRTSPVITTATPGSYYYQPAIQATFSGLEPQLQQPQRQQALNQLPHSSSSTGYTYNPQQTVPSSAFTSFDYSGAFKIPEYSTTQQQQQQQQQQITPTGIIPSSSRKQQPSYPLSTQPTLSSITNALSPSAAAAFRQHQKNNLSISSHFNLVSLGPGDKRPGSHLSDTSTSTLSTTAVATSKHPAQRSSTFDNTVINDLLINLASVDGSNINNYLLSVLYKLNTPLAIDDFYNLLYNNDRLRDLLDLEYHQKLDKTIVPYTTVEFVIEGINQLLNFFKNPNLLEEYLPNLEDKENKLLNINYHELLRTFLAIKILYEILIQLPLGAEEDPQSYTIPRLSIYKTYFIICQKLINNYPSSSNTTSEQQKLILGQSKLGKLIKLVYPNLLIKRLGSRGESKYNYLGVIWNENIVSEDIKQLCAQNELSDLSEIFSGEIRLSSNQLLGSSTTPKRSGSHKRSSSKHKIKVPEAITESSPTNPFLSTEQPTTNPTTTGPIPQVTSTAETTTGPPLSSPNLSCIKPFLKFPAVDTFSILNSENEDNWFTEVLFECYNRISIFGPNLIHEIFLKNENLVNNSSLLNNLMETLIKPLNIQVTIPNIDLCLYLVIVIELSPYLLLIKSSTNINLLKTLRLNLMHLINNLNSELTRLNSPKFPINNSTIFLIVIKKLINLNDLLITFIKLINKDSKKSMMSTDIENFLKMNSQTLKLEAQDDDDSLLFNLNTNLNTTSMGEINFSFRNDILSNDLVYTLIGYNFDPNINSELRSSISMKFINEEINIIDDFFKKDLLMFLNSSFSDEEEEEVEEPEPRGDDPTQEISQESLEGLSPSIQPQAGAELPSTTSGTTPSTGTSEKRSEGTNESVLSPREFSRLQALINLIDKRLLSQHFKAKYPILIYNNYITFILNDILKYIFLKQQQAQLQNLQRSTQDLDAGGSGGSNNSFGNWWVFNSFIQEYMSLMGEIVGLYDSVEKG